MKKLLSESAKSFVVPLADKNKNIVITPLFAKSKKEVDAYFIEMLPLVDSDYKQSAEKEKVRRNLVFQNELQSILVLLVKEKSVENIAEEILMRCIDITNSDFGVIVFHQGEEVRSFLYVDNNT